MTYHDSNMDLSHSSKNKISIARYLKKVNDNFGQSGDIRKAITEYGIDLAEEIHKSLKSKEDLKLADNNDPKSTTPVAFDRSKKKVSPEILGWSIAILSVAWAEWVFTSRSNNPAYQSDPRVVDRQAASANVKIALPYVYNSITDTLSKAQQIGKSAETNYEPDFTRNPAEIELRKR
jgi:hypothetical protein